MTSTDSTTAYPGEFEVLSTKAETGWWDSGDLTLTNYRLSWKPSRFSSTPAFSFELANIASVRKVRPVQYLFMSYSLRFELKDGAVYEIHNPKEDINRLLHLVEDYRSRERYSPGSLFGNRP